MVTVLTTDNHNLARLASSSAGVAAHCGQAVHDAYGFYTSYNGAIAAWALLSAQ
jgi:hypothetical protein